MIIGQHDILEIGKHAAVAHVQFMPESNEKQTFENITPEQVGARLEIIRTAFELDKAEIADMLEIDRPHWSLYENGKRVIPYEKASRVCRRFGVTLDFIIRGEPQGLEFSVLEKLRSAGFDK